MLYAGQNEAESRVSFPVQLNLSSGRTGWEFGWETAVQLCDHFFLRAEKLK